MAIIKCKMCGGDIELAPDKTFGVCEYCGSTMTFPKVDDDQRAAMFNRGNHFRRISEFDKALAVYEHIVQEDEADAEAHWCCALCRFGIEYVEDPDTHEWLPTCHRASFDNFLEDVDYLAAVEYSDGVTRRQYQKDAAKIAQVQRGILATSQNEEPFDVFICYKESDEEGNRTVDSTLAQEIYYELTEQGRRVFFARITLEDKAGSQYEPYIFAALNSARVMVAVGTKPEHFNAVWVKNEWSRYLALMKNDRKRLLIPCYRGMDPYDLPEQLSVLQSYDMGKIGFIQDLIRGVAKVLDAGKAPAEPARETVVQSEGGSLAALLKRGGMAMEDGEWKKADEFFEQALNLDAEYAEAYFGKALAAYECRSAMELAQIRTQPRTYSAKWQTACEEDGARIAAAVEKYRIPEYLDEDMIRQQFSGFDRNYESVLDAMRERIKEEEDYFEHDKIMGRAMRYAKGDFRDSLQKMKAGIYASLQNGLEQVGAKEQETVRSIAEQYDAFLDAAEKKTDTLWREALKRREADYAKALEDMEKSPSELKLISIAERLERLEGYRDSAALAEQCRNESARLTEEYKAGQEVERKKRADRTRRARRNKVILIVIFVAAIIIIASLAWTGIKRAKEMEALPTTENDRLRLALRGELAAHDTIAAGDSCTIGLKSDGTVMIAGFNGSEEYDVDGWSDIIMVSAGDFHVVGLKSDGTAVAVGGNNFDQCNVGGWSDIIAVSAGDSYTVGLKADGTVVAIGDNNDGQCSVNGWSDIVAVAAGESHTAGLKSDGTVVAVGDNGNGRCNVGNWSDIVAVAAGNTYTAGLKSDGTVIVAGDVFDGKEVWTDWSNIVAISAGRDHIVGLKLDGTAIAMGNNDNGQCVVFGWSDVVAIAAGDNHTIGLKSDGTVIAAGSNGVGQCDADGWTDIQIPKSHD